MKAVFGRVALVPCRHRRAWSGSRPGDWPRPRPARSALPASSRQRVGGALQRGDGLRIGRRRAASSVLQRRLQLPRRARGSARACAPVRPARSLHRRDLVDLGNLAKLIGNLVDVVDVRQHHVDRVGAERRIGPQVEEGRDRLDRRASQIDRIEVEVQVDTAAAIRRPRPGRCRRSPECGDAPGTGRPAPARDSRSARASPGGLQDGQQRRQHGDAGDVGDQHADAGDLAELRDALVVGREKRQEARRDRGGRERQRRADLLGGARPAPNKDRRA